MTANREELVTLKFADEKNKDPNDIINGIGRNAAQLETLALDLRDAFEALPQSEKMKQMGYHYNTDSKLFLGNQRVIEVPDNDQGEYLTDQMNQRVGNITDYIAMAGRIAIKVQEDQFTLTPDEAAAISALPKNLEFAKKIFDAAVPQMMGHDAESAHKKESFIRASDFIKRFAPAIGDDAKLLVSHNRDVHKRKAGLLSADAIDAHKAEATSLAEELRDESLKIAQNHNPSFRAREEAKKAAAAQAAESGDRTPAG